MPCLHDQMNVHEARVKLNNDRQGIVRHLTYLDHRVMFEHGMVSG